MQCFANSVAHLSLLVHKGKNWSSFLNLLEKDNGTSIHTVVESIVKLRAAQNVNYGVGTIR